ncbi:MAG: hypothetical protein FJZ57_07285 [Chlamydiae bacterium]|nr:hypothetical protein [Chlamydiota bacterium]
MNISKEIHDLIAEYHLSNEPFSIVPLLGGGNNRIYIIENDKDRFILKHYFQHQNDKRNRLKNEYLFLEYCKNIQLNLVPVPLHFNEKNNIALYSFIGGRQAIQNDVNENTIKVVCEFYKHLNIQKHLGSHLSPASEACFKYSDYVKIIENRIQSFGDFHEETSLDKDVLNFLTSEFSSTWNKVKQKFLVDGNLSINTDFFDDVCISPSDFGFHNTLIDTGSTRFIDFEYAGWDDPAKTICDFFLQPKIPVDKEYFKVISESFAQSSKQPENLLQRVKKVQPICQLKWVLILLNGFSKVGRNRRDFSSAHNISALENQLIKAKDLLNTIEV